MNPWHDVHYGEEAPEVVNAIVEIPRGSRNKYELDKESGMLKLDRVLYSAVYYPHNYGFIPQTYGDDDDPLDILIIGSWDVVPLCIVEAKVIGAMIMWDEGKGDEKIIAVSRNDMHVAAYNDMDDLPTHLKRELRDFFEFYKRLENKEVKVEQFEHAKEARAMVENCIANYRNKFMQQG